MPFFMDYYKNTMAPSMVFIDGPRNPYSDHVMRLAVSSPGLQHAICALSACNLRMKRRLSLGLGSTRELYEKVAADKATSADQALAEEQQHRNMAVNILNQQLNDPARATHDSALATILLLCHYRMAESGIAKFHMHFAGVKNILALRQSHRIVPSSEAAWMEAIFTYFDATSASINERETQLGGDMYGRIQDMPLLPAGSENLFGCERDLFRTIRRLARLNLLSQNKSLRHPDNDGQARTQHAATFGGAASLGQLGYRLVSSGSASNDRAAFWEEWNEVRQALQSWEFDASQLQATLPCDATAAQLRDLGCLSEAFRYAALLYTERLANPSPPSSSANFQNLVSQVVYYATSLEASSAAEKFLLWPLFVAGSECVNDLQRNIVRAKCRDIMARSGYMNNLAALEILETLWAEDATRAGRARSDGTGPFNWTRYIAQWAGEVEWIMF